MLKAIVIPALLAVFGVLFLLACIGEKNYQNKVLYAVVASVMLALLLASTRL